MFNFSDLLLGSGNVTVNKNKHPLYVHGTFSKVVKKEPNQIISEIKPTLHCPFANTVGERYMWGYNVTKGVRNC